jgi:acyl transferase domain-containing protein
VNSFGYGGANAHTILESVDTILPGYRNSTQADSKTALLHSHTRSALNNGHSNGHSSSSGRSWYLLPFSAHDDRTLHENIRALGQAPFTWALGDVAYTLSARRSVLSHRAFSVAEKSSIQECLEAAHTTAGKKMGSSVPTVAFIFTGQSYYPYG